MVTYLCVCVWIPKRRSFMSFILAYDQKKLNQTGNFDIRILQFQSGKNFMVIKISIIWYTHTDTHKQKQTMNNNYKKNLIIKFKFLINFSCFFLNISSSSWYMACLMLILLLCTLCVCGSKKKLHTKLAWKQITSIHWMCFPDIKDEYENTHTHTSMAPNKRS